MKKKSRIQRMVTWGSDSGKDDSGRLFLDRMGREEISMKVTFQKRPRKQEI